MNNNDEDSGHGTASFLDKVDWRRTIHRCLENCVRCEDTNQYPQAVKSLVSAVAADYPGFPARELITNEIIKIKEYYSKWTKAYFVRNPDYWYHPFKRKIIQPKLLNSYYKEIFEFIKNLLAKHRILLWGIRRTPGGEQIGDVEY